ncbi:MAG: type II toxin-antitoxin system VapB family antitoxin [Rubrobacter sp.]|nr:type II toxin-antitoxin system VapB family antitoxin [Rubrobacter sp.]MBA3950581.1 type II toxin-antitoxin system VapB family antitoxin [Rubrobacter sp.]MDQ3360224.1 type II toxin-antitoxin system VapB family antitoxin [Actinomycetota bacterium]
MRTTVTMSEEVASDLMRFTEARTRTAAVNRAVEEWVRQERLRRLRSLRGKLPVEAGSERLREAEVEEVADL